MPPTSSPTPVNPILPGCHPDPSICRVGQDYFLVTSSFAYFPAVPVHHSRDLVRWELIGHVVSDVDHLRSGNVDFRDTDICDGVWAPTIRHHEGIFYVVFAIAHERRGHSTLLVTATDPRGPWSTPVVLDADGIDPSLFFDRDGTCWFAAARDTTSPRATGPAEIYLRRLDLGTLTLVGPTTIAWHGALTGAWAEAPHVFERDGRYHLLAAEGGTERRHAVTAAQADAVTGPWRTDPRSPLLTHRHLSPDHPVQNVGHADLVDDPDGATWAVVLGVRPHAGTHTLGREVFLVPVDWNPAGPVFAPGSGIVTATSADWRSAAEGPTPPTAGDPAWTTVALTGVAMSSLRGPVKHLRGTGDEGPGAVLPVGTATLSSVSGTPSFLGWPQRDLHFRAEMRCTLPEPTTPAQCGLALINTADAWAAVVATVGADGKTAFTVVGAGLGTHRQPTLEIPSSREVVFAIDGDGDAYRFSVGSSTPGDACPTVWHPVSSFPRDRLSTESAGGFLGVHLGPYATSDGVPVDAALRVDELRYRPTATATVNGPLVTGAVSLRD